MAEDLDTYTHLPLLMDPQSKSISLHPSSGLSSIQTRALQTELDHLNALHRSLHAMDAPHLVPPPPIPVNPKRSAQVSKLRDSGNAEYKKQKYAEAAKFYTLGIQMALARPLWEPSQLVREEVHSLFSNRAQAHMWLQEWPEAAVDAEASVEAKRVGNAKAWFRRGKALLEMGRLEEAREWVGKGLEVEGEEKELAELGREVERRLEIKVKGEGKE